MRQPAGGRVPYLERNPSRTSLTSAAWVHSMPCGAPSISTYSALGRALANRRPVTSIGRMLSAVPWTIRAGTSILGMSARKSVSQVGCAAADAVGPPAVARFQLARMYFLAEPRGAQEGRRCCRNS